ncbi:MAG: alginate O-acetyltransferase AlgX-related protein [bacterium]
MKTDRIFIALVFLILWFPLAQMVFPLVPSPFLYGVQKTAILPRLSFSKIMNHAFQKGVEDWFNQNYGGHAIGVKTNRQIYFSLFGDVRENEGIILGRQGQLLNDAYIKRTLQFDAPCHFNKVVERLVQINRLLRARDKTFLLFITPSKSTTYPAEIPAAYGSFPHYQPGADYENFMAAVRSAGIPYVDAKALVEKAATGNAHRLFPQGGIHWDDQAAALAARALLRGINRVSRKSIGQIQIDAVRYDRIPTGHDVDYADLLNLWAPPLNFEGVHVTAHAIRGRDYGRLSLQVEGGSFATQVLQLYCKLGFFKSVDSLAYNRYFYPFTATGPQAPRDQWDWKKDILQKDVIVLEINDPMIGTGDPDVFSNGFLRDLLERLKMSAKS